VGIAPHLDRDGELRGEDGQGAELAREHEVEEGPDLHQPVLDGSPRQDEPVRRRELLANQGELDVRVPYLVPLVQDRVTPPEVQELVLPQPQLLVGRDQNPPA